MGSQLRRAVRLSLSHWESQTMFKKLTQEFLISVLVWSALLELFGMSGCSEDVTNSGPGGIAENDAATSLDTSRLNNDAAIKFADETASVSQGTDVQSSDSEVAAIEPGTFGAPCSKNTDCNSTYCIDTSDGKACTTVCVDSCPNGFACVQNTAGGSDNAFICVDRFARLCDPCTTNTDCATQSNGDNVCLLWGDAGSFCGVSCMADSDCADGFGCAAYKDEKTGIASHQCRPLGDAACSCSPRAQKLGLKTSCVNTGVKGACRPGTRACSASGLSSCSGSPPTSEKCNEIDDDCNGATDEGLCEDGNSCTSDVCNTDGSCKHKQLDGVPCTDGSVCTKKDTCASGVCVGGDFLKCVDNEVCTSDECDPVTGCYFKPAPGPCDDGDVCTLSDKCSLGKCSPGTEQKKCGDTNPCTQDLCNPTKGCYHTSNDNAPCESDGKSCTLDTCKSGQCVHLPQGSGCK